ncbi:MAG: hypothetical protein ACM3MK_06500 [Chitinophagales bacterium]
MNLVDIEEQFNKTYGFAALRSKTIALWLEVVTNADNSFLSEERDKLPDGVNFSDLGIEYKRTHLILNDTNRTKPYFRLYLELLHPTTSRQMFWYEVEYDIDGNFSDEFFGYYD